MFTTVLSALLQSTVFNRQTGMWNFPSLSQHCPLPDYHPLLQRAGRSRLHHVDSGETLELVPPLVDDHCKCGAGYLPTGILPAFTPMLYTLFGPVKCQVRNVFLNPLHPRSAIIQSVISIQVLVSVLV